jgi:hypothetical protein
VLPRTEVAGLIGAQRLEGVHVRDNVTRETSIDPVCGLFVFMGAAPRHHGSGSERPLPMNSLFASGVERYGVSVRTTDTILQPLSA